MAMIDELLFIKKFRENKAEKELQKARLELLGHCSPSQADQVDRYILQYMPKGGR